MPRVNDLHPEEWLKAKHLSDGDQTLTITKDGETTFNDQKTGQSKRQIVLHFAETDLKLGLNAGNANTLVEVLGSDDSHDWIGSKIVVGCATANNGTDYVQVRKKPTQAANRKPRPLPSAQQAHRPTQPQPMTQAEVDDDSDIPF